MIELSASSSHLFPGALCVVTAGSLGDGPVIVAFADNSIATGVLDGVRMRLGDYETAAGTCIPAHDWTVGIVDAATLRITAKVI